MTKDKLLLGLVLALSAAVAVLAVVALNLSQSDEGRKQPVLPDPVPSVGTSSPVARAGGQTLTEDAYVEGLRDDFGEEWIQEWLERTVVRLEAQKLEINLPRELIDQELISMQRGYESEAQFYEVMREQLGLTSAELREDILHQLMLEAIVTRGIEISDADIDDYMREHPELYGPQHEVRYSQIIVASEKEANAILELLNQGFEFATIARDQSLDEATAPEGGDYGWMNVNDPFLPAKILETLNELGVGGVSAPVRMADGTWAIVTLLGRRTLEPGDDAAVREEVRRELALSEAPSTDKTLDMLLDKYDAEMIAP